MAERIQKMLARAGYGSRREIERWMQQGDILVNGKQPELGMKITETDQIILRGQRLRLESKLNATPKVLMYHKRSGEVSTTKDPEGRPTVFDRLPKLPSGRWIQIGRLDFNTDGLLLFTNDGELANRLMHPSWEIEREYAVRVLGEVSDDMLQQLKTGVELEDGIASFTRIQFAGGEGANQWYHVILKEGRTREVRRLWEAFDLKVSRLIRIRYGTVTLPRYLARGRYEELEFKAMRSVYESVDLRLNNEFDSAQHRANKKAKYGNNRGKNSRNKSSRNTGKNLYKKRSK